MTVGLAGLMVACGGGGGANGPADNAAGASSAVLTAPAVGDGGTALLPAPSEPAVLSSMVPDTLPVASAAAYAPVEPAIGADPAAVTAPDPGAVVTSHAVGTAAPAAGPAATSTTFAPAAPQLSASALQPAAVFPRTRAEAARFLVQATFGPTEAEIDRVMQLGYAGWIDEQAARPQGSHRAAWEAADAFSKSAGGTGAGQEAVINAFWQHAVQGNDPLRQRLAYALSQIFVVSMLGSEVGNQPRALADYLDTLGRLGLGHHRELLQAVTLHPMMGLYLSALRNQKADATTGRVPDENFARELMQLFTIGLHQLQPDGTRLLVNGQPLDTYGAADVAGLARIFTGWSWACPAWPEAPCFFSGKPSTGSADPDRHLLPMRAYPNFHSADAKVFLGVTVPQQAVADPQTSLAVALDTLHQHPNAGPFLARQLIQRLVTSNPSPAYVAAVASAFDNNGAGQRGDLLAVVKAVLLHAEARTPGASRGKVREPVLRLAALLRAVNATSDSGRWLLGFTDSVTTQLGQTPLRAPSVFNFFRPGYVPPGTAAAEAGLVAPEMQLVNESSVAAYVNFMRDALASGVGTRSATLLRRDVQLDLAPALALAERPAELVSWVDERLMQGAMPVGLRAEIAVAVQATTVPALNAARSNAEKIDNTKRMRVYTALLLALASPEFQVQQ